MMKVTTEKSSLKEAGDEMGMQSGFGYAYMFVGEFASHQQLVLKEGEESRNRHIIPWLLTNISTR